MAKFRLRIEELASKKSAEQGKRISQKDLAEQSGVAITTLSRWTNQRFERLDADLVMKLQRYFDCSLDELIEVIE